MICRLGVDWFESGIALVMRPAHNLTTPACQNTSHACLIPVQGELLPPNTVVV